MTGLQTNSAPVITAAIHSNRLPRIKKESKIPACRGACAPEPRFAGKICIQFTAHRGLSR